jgi:Ca-activated chloride channel family protein
MSLGAPGALWWLALIPLVILFYMLRARREARSVPSTLLWERATRDLVARLPMRRLERSLLLLLQILAVAAVALALARPSLALPGLAGNAVVLVIKTGASMQATDEDPTRLAAAQREALVMVAHLGARQPAALVAAGTRPVLVADFTTDRALLAAAIRNMKPSDAGSAVDEALTLAASPRVEGRPARVHLFSDHPPSDPRVQWHRVGQGAPNAAITSASARRDGRGGTQVLVRLEAFGGTFPSRTLVVALDGRPVAQREVRLVPGAPQTLVFDLGAASGIAAVTLQGKDALPADDRAALAVGREGLPRVLVVGDANPVLDAVLAAVATSNVTRTDRIAPDEWGRADLVVLDSVQPLPLPPGAYMLIGTLGINLPVQVDGTIQDQVIRSVVATHPVTRLADLRGVRVTGGFAMHSRAGSILAEGDAPLVWVYESRDIRAVVLPFALNQSDLPLHPAFPVLVANAIDWLAGGRQAAPGDAPVIPAGLRRTAMLLPPDGVAVTVRARDGVFALPPLDHVGLYRLRAEGWERRWVVSTVDSRESDLVVAPAPTSPVASETSQSAQVPLTPWLLGLAAALMAGEWMLWARTVPKSQVPGRRGGHLRERRVPEDRAR